MKRSECWMTFSEALEKYLSARDCAINRTAGWKDALDDMERAAEHMDALAPLEDEK